MQHLLHRSAARRGSATGCWTRLDARCLGAASPPRRATSGTCVAPPRSSNREEAMSLLDLQTHIAATKRIAGRACARLQAVDRSDLRNPREVALKAMLLCALCRVK